MEPRVRDLLTHRGQLEDALRHTERALAISRETGTRVSEANALVNLGLMWAWLGDLERARKVLEPALELSRALGARSQEGYALAGLSRVASEEGDDARAADLAGEALALRRTMGHGSGVAQSLVEAGRLRHRSGDVEAARAHVQEAMDLLREQDPTEEAAIALALLACLPGGDAEAAEAALAEAPDIADRPDAHYHLWQATGNLAHLREAKRRLDYYVEHAPEEYRETMLTNVRLHREIDEAWSTLDAER